MVTNFFFSKYILETSPRMTMYIYKPSRLFAEPWWKIFLVTPLSVMSVCSTQLHHVSLVMHFPWLPSHIVTKFGRLFFKCSSGTLSWFASHSVCLQQCQTPAPESRMWHVKDLLTSVQVNVPRWLNLIENSSQCPACRLSHLLLLQRSHSHLM